MAAKHTPGPWSHWEDQKDRAPAPDDAGGVSNAPFGICAADSGISIAELWFGTDCGQHISRDEAEANATLIAAAPEMLEALKVAQGALAMLVSPDAIISTSSAQAWAAAVEAEAKARASIAWAEGR